jgi:uncharacterized repeat protein (TIGR03803 family)
MKRMNFTNASCDALRPAVFAMMVCVLTIGCLRPAQAQNYRVIHSFTGNGDGYQPYAGLTIDRGGHLYGTTSEFWAGTVFEMKQVNGAWILNTIFTFDVNNGLIPYSKVVFGPGGSMFGTTLEGGDGFCEFGCGAVYNIRPPQTVCKSVSCPWSGTAIASFSGGNDGYDPNFVDPVFDQQGNLYGTTALGGSHGLGNVFKLTHSGGTWTASNIYEFSGPDGTAPFSGLVWDQAGNLYGTTGYGGQFDYGTVYRLSPSGGGWTLTTLYSFQNTTDGEHPSAALILDGAGNLYGATVAGGSGGGGTVFKLAPSGGTYTFSVLHSFNGIVGNFYPGVFNALVLDAAGSLYGSVFAATTNGEGAIFKLTPSVGGTWTYTSLHDFGGPEGANPVGSVAFDANGNLFGTTLGGGLNSQNCESEGPAGCGVVWEITP